MKIPELSLKSSAASIAALMMVLAAPAAHAAPPAAHTRHQSRHYPVPVRAAMSASSIPSNEITPLWKIHRGMVGYGLTVFHGTKVSRFGVRVIDILKDAYMGHDLILVRMSGGPITERGANIIAGMSGSPVYLDGKLAGAVSMGYQWPREPVAMVTPIEDMADAFNPRLPTRPEFAAVPWSRQPLDFAAAGFSAGGIDGSANNEKTWAQRFADAAAAAGFLSPGSTTAAAPENTSEGEMIARPLVTPIYISGLSPQLSTRLNRVISPYGLQVTTGLSSGSAPASASSAQLEPGSMMGVFFCTGDIQIGAYGTVTYRKGSRILAFGHPLEMLGPIDFPLSTAYVAEVFSSFSKSEKMCEPGRVVGALLQDRPWSVMGAVGQSAHTVPMTIQIRDDGTDKGRTFHVRCVDHPLWTGMVADLAAQEAVSEVRSYPGDSMADVRVEVDPAGMTPIVRTNTYFDYFDPNGMGSPALADMDHILDILQSNPFRAVPLDGIKVSVQIHPGRKMSTIERIAVDRSTVAPGDRVHVDVTLRPWKGVPVVKPMDVQIPADAPSGPATLIITGGMLGPLPSPPSTSGGFTITFGGAGRAAPEPAGSLDEIIARYLKTDRNTDLVGRIVASSSPSYNIGGERLYDLPPAISAVLHSPRSTGTLPLVDESRTIVHTSSVMLGAQALPLTIERHENDAVVPAKTAAQSVPAPSSSGPGAPVRAADAPPRAAPAHRSDVLSDHPSTYGEGDGDPVGGDPGSAGPSDEIVPPVAAETATSGSSLKPAAATTDNLASPDTSSAEPSGAAADGVTKKLKTWIIRTPAEFETGKGSGIAIGSLGELTVAPKSRRLQYLDTDDYIWTARSTTLGGGQVLLGTGNHGRIYRLQDDRPVLALQTPELDVLAVAFGPDGSAYAGTAPHGFVYRLPAAGSPPAHGTPQPFFRTGKNYVLALAAAGDGTVYAGTNGGAVYRISPSGAGTLWFQSSETHICALAIAPNGDVLAGTSPSGLVYDITPGGESSVLWNSGDTSVSSIAVMPDRSILIGTAPRGEIARIRTDGSPAVIVTSANDAVHDIAVSGGEGYAAAGTTVYQVLPTNEYRKIREPQDQELLTITSAPGGGLIGGTGGIAAVYRLDPSAQGGDYRSAVKDAGAPAQWGHIRWDGELPQGSSVAFQTRTGDSAQPDSTWHAWQDASVTGDGAVIRSPRARYIQLRVALKPAPGGAGPAIHSLELSYMPANRPPTITVSSPAAGANVHGKIDVQWQAQDPDGDALLYQLSYSRDNGATWKTPSLLTSDGKPVTGNITASSYQWDTTGLGDGAYLLRVVVSDRRSNPEGALEASAVAGPFQVVNRQPVLRLPTGDLKVQRDGSVLIDGTASGSGSPIVAVSYRIDAGAWFAAAPATGLFDSDLAAFSIHTDPILPGEHKIEIRASGASGETATSTLTVKRPPAG